MTWGELKKQMDGAPDDLELFVDNIYMRLQGGTPGWTDKNCSKFRNLPIDNRFKHAKLAELLESY